MYLATLNKKARALAALALLGMGVASISTHATVASTSHAPRTAPVGRTQAPAQGYSTYGHYFSETTQASSGAFWGYWNQHGGLAQQGFPISEELVEKSDTNGKEYLVQYYERAVFEYHPETQGRVLLSLLGNFEYRRKYPSGAPGQQPNTSAGSTLFKETGKRVGGAFLDYWKSNGGLAQQGFPISEEFMEKSPIDGKTYRVQYFERAVFEMHPETPKTPVLLSLLGRFRYEQKYQSNLPNLRGDVDGDKIGDADDLCPKVAENVNQVFDTDGCPDTMVTLMTFVAEDLDNYWAGIFKEDGKPYVGPTEFVAYSEEIPYACGTTGLNNASYCGLSHGIYYHWEFMQQFLAEEGDFAPVTVLAHEWGHLVQGNLGRLNGQYPTIDTELQADCYAGAWSAHAEERGYLDEGDLAEGANTIFKVGDGQDLPWFEPGAHGQPEERTAAFTVGYRQGVVKCEQYTR